MTDPLTTVEEEAAQAALSLKELFKEAFYDDLVKRIEKAETAVNEVARLTKVTSKHSVHEILDKFSESFEQLTEDALTRCRETDERFTAVDDSLKQAQTSLVSLTKTSSELVRDLGGRLNQIEYRFDERSTELIQRLQDLETGLQDLANKLSTRLEELERNSAAEFDTRLKKSTVTLEDRLQELEAKLDTRLKNSTETLEDLEKNSTETLKKRIEDLEKNSAETLKKLERKAKQWVLAGACFAAGSMGWISYALMHRV